MICSCCRAEKLEADFPFDNKKKGTRNYACRECRNTWKKAWYEKNREKHIRRANANQLLYRQISYKFIMSYLSNHPCVICGEKDPVVLEFHHRDRKTKSYTVGRMYGQGVSQIKIKKEISKCDVLCANCHKRQTLTKRKEWLLANG